METINKLPNTPPTAGPKPSKQYNLNDLTWAQKLEIVCGDQRFKGLEKVGEQWKITVCTWNGVTLRNISFTTTKDNSVDWAMNSLNLVK